MSIKNLSLVTLLLISVNLFAQTNNSNLKNSSEKTTKTQNDEFELLPSKMIFTQRLLWGNKGLMRSFNKFELTAENRKKELKIRRNMLKAHQIMGFVTMGSMITQIALGTSLYNGNNNVKGAHEAFGAITNISYITTASLSLFAPPRMFNEHKGYSNLKLHRILAIVHITGMITTNVLATMLENNPDLKPYHMAAAITTFASFATASIVIKL